MQLTRLIYASNHDSIAVEAVDHILQRSVSGAYSPWYRGFR